MNYKIDMASVEKLVEEDRHAHVDSRRGQRLDIVYDARDGEMWSKFYVDENSWTRYHSDAIIVVARTNRGHAAEWYIEKLEEALQYQLNLDPEWCETYGVSE